MPLASLPSVDVLRPLLLAGASDRLLGAMVRDLLADSAPVRESSLDRLLITMARAIPAEEAPAQAPSVQPREVSASTGLSAAITESTPSPTSPVPLSPPSPPASPVFKENPDSAPVAPKSVPAPAVRKVAQPRPAKKVDRVLVNYETAAGKRTSTNFPASRWAMLLSFQPDESELRRAVREICENEEVPPGRSLPDWVFETLIDRLADAKG